MKSLKSRQNRLSEASAQLELLRSFGTTSFHQKLNENKSFPLHSREIDTLQINLGKMCNQVCKHCHVDAGPDRKEIMTKKVMEDCLNLVRKNEIKIVDLTGGAPEMNPNFRWFVEQLSETNVDIIVRCNLTIILANKKYNDLPDFFKKHKVQVVSSLPHFSANRTDRQRGDGVFDKSIRALKLLNEVGYGTEDSDLELNLVFNPAGALLPGNQKELERDFKQKLKDDFGIQFNNLFTITNMPISRFLEYLEASNNLEDYMDKLINSYNPQTINGLMCKNTLSVGWEGSIYDCDFNQMLEIPIKNKISNISEIQDLSLLANREIAIDNHCYGCTAGSGSSCGGETI